MMRNTTRVTAKPASAATVNQTAQRIGPSAAREASPPTLGNDLLRGADEIAEFLFGDATLRRKVYYLTGDARIRMPHFKLGATICARKSTLVR